MSQTRKKHRKSATDREPWMRRLPPELQTNPKSVAWAKAMDQHEEDLREFKRTIVDFYELYKACPSQGCRRAHRCLNPELPCYEDILPLLRKHLFPWLLPAIEKRLAEKRVANADKQPESPL